MRLVNKRKAHFAQMILTQYEELTGSSVIEGDALGDLLADLHHWCELNGQSFEEANDRALAHFKAEMAGDE